jgi:hypothetical protein
MDPVLLVTLIVFGISLIAFLVVFANSEDGGGGGTTTIKETAHEDSFKKIVGKANVWAKDAEDFMSDYMAAPANARDSMADRWRELRARYKVILDERNDWEEEIEKLAAQKDADGKPIMSEKTRKAYIENMSQKFQRATESIGRLRKETAFDITNE